jgi:hypothetical protein
LLTFCVSFHWGLETGPLANTEQPVKLAVRVVELKARIKLHLPSSAPCQPIFALVLGRMPKLIN